MTTSDQLAEAAVVVCELVRRRTLPNTREIGDLIAAIECYDAEKERALKVPLRDGKFALVDAEDFERIATHLWHVGWDDKSSTFRCMRPFAYADGTRTTQSMAREVMGLQPGDDGIVDHINHDGLDNRKCNLRVGTVRSNSENRRDQSSWGPGVYKHTKCVSDRWWAEIRMNGKRHYCGMFDSPKRAAEARQDCMDHLLAARKAKEGKP